MHLLRQLLWIAAAVLAFASWLTKERWLGALWKIAMAGFVIALLALAAWIAADWIRGRAPRK